MAMAVGDGDEVAGAAGVDGRRGNGGSLLGREAEAVLVDGGRGAGGLHGVAHAVVGGVAPDADVVVLVLEVSGGSVESGGGTGRDAKVVDGSGAGGVTKVVLEAPLGSGSVLQGGHVQAVVLGHGDAPPGGSSGADVDVDGVASVAVRVHDHVLSGVVAADDGRGVAGAAGDGELVGGAGADGGRGAGGGGAGGGGHGGGQGQGVEL